MKNVVPRTRQCLPLELTLECFCLLFPPSYFEHGSITGKADWKDIEGLTLTSKGFRELILSLWFHVLRISNLEDWKAVLRSWKRLYRWTRVIHYSSTVYKTPRSLLEPFTRLHSIRIDLPTTHVVGTCDFDFAAPEISQILHDSIPGKLIQHLEIRGITWLDPVVMRHLAEALPNLRTLSLRQPLVWCGLCNTIGAPGFRVIPGKIVYSDGTGLPDGYSQYLSPLRHLHTVKLTVACGEGDIAYDVLFSNVPSQGINNAPTDSHDIGSPRISDALGLTSSATSHSVGPSKQRTTGWSGECESCMNQLLDDDVFRLSWMVKKGANINRPPSLRVVEWNLLELSAQNWPGLLPSFVGQNTIHCDPAGPSCHNGSYV